LEYCIAAVFLALAQGRLTAFAIEIGNYNFGTLPRKPDCGAVADSASRTGYDGNLFFKPSHDFSLLSLDW
jgi:hypothetical protein